MIHRAESGFLKGMNPTATLISMAVIILFVLFGTLMTETSSQLFEGIKNYIILSLNWYYIGLVAFFIFFIIWLLLSRYGNLRLGDDDEQPEFSYFSWFAMLFSAGMGIGLVFWSIAEPIYHFQDNPFITEGLTPEAAQVAMRITFLHWGLHPWAIYVIVGLSLAYFTYRKKLPLTFRSALYPVIGNKIYGPIGHAVDIIAVFGTLFGLATSLGLGIQQLDTGLAHFFVFYSYAIVEATAKESYLAEQCAVLTNAVEKTSCIEAAEYQSPFPMNLILLLAVITAIATLSEVSGLQRGVKFFSGVNLWLSIILLVFLFLLGPTRYLLNTLLQGIGDYLANVIPLSLWTDAYKNTGWQDSWTTFYWGWWIAWAPFVGIFVARISRGRTIREFILGVLLVPTLLSFIWLISFGGTALYLELFHTIVNEAGEVVTAIGQAGIIEAVNNDVTLALYTTFEKMDLGILGTIGAGIATLLIITYFITSSDSASLVVCTILSMGDEEPLTRHRVFWGVTEGVVAGVLLLLGGLQALQTASIIVSLPVSLIILVMIYGLLKALRQEKILNSRYA